MTDEKKKRLARLIALPFWGAVCLGTYFIFPLVTLSLGVGAGVASALISFTIALAAATIFLLSTVGLVKAILKCCGESQDKAKEPTVIPPSEKTSAAMYVKRRGSECEDNEEKELTFPPQSIFPPRRNSLSSTLPSAVLEGRDSDDDVLESEDDNQNDDSMPKPPSRKHFCVML